MRHDMHVRYAVSRAGPRVVRMSFSYVGEGPDLKYTYHRDKHTSQVFLEQIPSPMHGCAPIQDHSIEVFSGPTRKRLILKRQRPTWVPDYAKRDITQ